MATNKETIKPLTPDTFAEPNYGRSSVDFTKYVPWLKNFHQYQPPADHTIEIRKESK